MVAAYTDILFNGYNVNTLTIISVTSQCKISIKTNKSSDMLKHYNHNKYQGLLHWWVFILTVHHPQMSSFLVIPSDWFQRILVHSFYISLFLAQMSTTDLRNLWFILCLYSSHYKSICYTTHKASHFHIHEHTLSVILRKLATVLGRVTYFWGYKISRILRTFTKPWKYFPLKL